MNLTGWTPHFISMHTLPFNCSLPLLFNMTMLQHLKTTFWTDLTPLTLLLKTWRYFSNEYSFNELTERLYEVLNTSVKAHISGDLSDSAALILMSYVASLCSVVSLSDCYN